MDTGSTPGRRERPGAGPIGLLHPPDRRVERPLGLAEPAAESRDVVSDDDRINLRL
jgi:hypothetical protein